MRPASLPKQLLCLVLISQMLMLPLMDAAAATPRGIADHTWLLGSGLGPARSLALPAVEPGVPSTPTVAAFKQPQGRAKRLLPRVHPAPAMMQAQSIAVSVGYADNLRPNPNFPVPWQGSPNILFLGSGPTFDAGAIRIDNSNSTPVSIDSVVVDLGRPGPTFNLWGSFTIPAQNSAILTQTGEFNFDTSDFPIVGCGQPLSPNESRIPTVTITIGGVPSTFIDTGHILDTGGFDLVCQGNESLGWRPIGTTGIQNTSAQVTLSPPTSVQATGTPYTAKALVTDAGNQPIANVVVNFNVLSGPNAGKSGQATTDSTGTAAFTYTSLVVGTDILQATVTNAAGGSIQSDQVTTTWTSSSPCSPSVSQPPGASVTTISFAGQGVGEFNDPLTLAAQLTDGNGNPLPGRPLSFTLAEQPFQATTDGNGVATVSVSAAPTPGVLALNVNFAGEANFQASQLSTTVTIGQEETAIRYTGSTLLGTGVPQQVTAVLVDGQSGAPIANEIVTFVEGSVHTQGTTNAQGVATATLTLASSPASGQTALQVSFAGDNLYKASRTSVPVTVFLPTSFVIWGGNSGGLQLGQDVNFWGHSWTNQVTGGNFTAFTANPSFKGWADPVGQIINVCEVSAGTGGPLDDHCWSSKPGNSFPPATLPPFIEVIVSTAITMSGSEIFGNIASTAVCKVDPTSVYGPDPGKPGFCKLVAVLQDGGNIFPMPPALTATQTQPTKVLQQQNFNVTATIANNSSTPASSVVLSESFDGVTPTTGSNNIGSILNGAQQTATFQVTSPAIPLRQTNESTADYETRLANTDGRVFTSTGTITFTDSVGQQFLPVTVSSSSQLQLPELTVGISGPSCVGPGSTIPYKVTVSNQGTAEARNVSILLNFPDGTNTTAGITSIPVAGSVTTTINFVVPAITAKQPNETDQQYRARLAAIDGSSLVALAKVNWQDALGNNYGDIQQKIVTTTERVPIITVTPQLPVAVSPGQQVTLNLSVQNIGGGNASQVLLQVTNPDGSTSSIAPFALQGGQANVVSSTFTAPVVPARQAGETDAAYQARLVSQDGKPLNFQVNLNWNDVAGDSYGPTTNPASTRFVVPIVTISLAAPPVSQSGATITYTVNGANIGHADAPSTVATITLPDGSTQQVISSTIPVQGTFQQFVNFTVPRSTPASTLTATATVNWRDASQDSYGPLSSTVTTANTNAQANQPPVVSAGPNQTIILPTNSLTLNGLATDDGKPSGVLLVSWSEVSGPAPVTFSNPNQAVTQATFTFTGTYVLRLTANDTQLTSTSDVTVTVNGAVVGNIEVCYFCNKDFGFGLFQDGPTFAISNTSTTNIVGGTLTIGPTGGSDSFSVGAIPAGGRAVVAPGLSNDGGTGHSFFAFHGGILDTSDSGQNGSDTQFRFLAQEGSFVVDSTVFTPAATQGPSLDGTVAVLNFLGGPNNADAPCNNCFDKIVATLTLSAVSVNTPVLSIAKAHAGNFNLGQQSATYTLTVTNAINASSTAGTVTVTDALPVGLTLVSMAGTGWTCINSSCTRTDSLLPAASYPAITVTVNVANNAVTPQINKATVSGGGAASAIATDSTIINGANPAPTVSAGPNQSVTLPANSVTLNGSASGGNGPLTLTWSEVSGPASVTFANPNSAVTQASFTTVGTYVLQLAATDGTNSASATAIVVVNASLTGATLQLSPVTTGPNNTGRQQILTATLKDSSSNPLSGVVVQFTVSGANVATGSATTDANGTAVFTYTGTNAGTDQVVAMATSNGNTAISNVSQIAWTVPAPVVGGWIGSPANGATVSTPLTISLQTVTLQSGTVSFFPSTNPSAVTVLNPNASGPAGTPLATFDPTTLANGSYTIQLQGIDSHGNQQTNVVQVTVLGGNKPGRITFSTTDVRVPLAGMSISITRTYDSLKRSTLQDFGFGWSLATTVDLQVDAANNVTFTVNGQRSTFFFEAQPSSPFFPFFLIPSYVPQTGFHGSLTSDGCNLLVHIQGNLTCFPTGPFQPTTYAYTDPVGRIYTISANGQIQSIKDLNGNVLSFGPNGITSSLAGGITVPFVRDSQGRITQISDLNNNAYIYSYDASGNLAGVSSPGVPLPTNYTYDPTHLLTGETDPRGNSTSTQYYSDGRLKSITDPMQNTTSFVYTVNADATTTTTTTFPDNGVQVRTDNSFGNPLSVTDPLNRTTTFTYDGEQNLLTRTDPLVNTTSYTYDANGFRTSSKDPLGDTVSLVNNAAGRPTTLTDELNHTQIATYDANFNLSTLTDSLGTILSITYNAQGQPTSVTDPRGNTHTFIFDALGNTISHTDPLNRTTAWTYDLLGHITRSTDPRGKTTQFKYDALGRQISKTDAAGNTTNYAYDGNNNRISETDALNRTTTYSYDALNRLAQINYPDGSSKQYTYDFRGNKLTETDQLGRVTKYVYDLGGQLTSVTYAFGTAGATTVSYTYDLDGRKLTEKDARGNTTGYTYDAAGRLTSIKDRVGNVTSYGYDARGQRISMTDAKNRVTTYSYDTRGQQLTVKFPDNTSITRTYDPLGKILTSQDEENRTTAFGYDAASQLVRVTDALGHVTQYSYDLDGNKASRTDANNNGSTYSYDALNHLTSRIRPGGQSESFTYDAVGNRLSRTDFNGKTTTFAYDVVNRLLSQAPDPSFRSSPTTFTYTATGKRASMTDTSGVTNYTYDNRDRVIGKSTPAGTLHYTYDEDGNVKSVVSSNTNGTNVSYAYDADNRLALVTDNSLHGAATYVYDPTSQVSSVQYLNGVTHGYSYDKRDRTTGMTITGPSGSIATYTQTFGPSGHKLSVTESSGRNTSYLYDALYRLGSENITGDPAVVNNGQLNYSLDPVGNRLSLVSTLAALASQSNTYNPDDQISGDTFDANGNTLSSSQLSFRYDFADRLTSATSGTVSVQMLYDGDGNRVARSEGGTTIRYLIDDLNPTGYPQITEEVLNGSVFRQYTYGLSRISQQQFIPGGGSQTRFLGYDAGGSVRQLTDITGVVTDTYSYDAFGNVVAQTGTTVNQFLYRGEQFDSSLGLYYLRARYYNPKTGRFLTQDKLEGGGMGTCYCASEGSQTATPASFHLYLYTGADPVNYRDPSGYGLIDEALLIADVVLQVTIPRIILPILINGTTVAISYLPFIAEIAAFATAAFCELFLLLDLAERNIEPEGPRSSPQEAACALFVFLFHALAE